MASEDRDRQFERALARHLRDEAAGAREPACLDAETLGTYHERLLSDEEMISAKSHVATCARCQEILAQLEMTQEIPEYQERARLGRSTNARANEIAAVSHVMASAPHAPAESPGAANASRAPVREIPRKKYYGLKWAVPAGAIAATLLLWVGIRESQERRLAAAKIEIVENGAQADREIAGQTVPASPPALSREPKRESKLKDKGKSDSAMREEPDVRKKSAPPAGLLLPGVTKDQPGRRESSNSAAVTAADVAPSVAPAPAPKPPDADANADALVLEEMKTRTDAGAAAKERDALKKSAAQSMVLGGNVQPPPPPPGVSAPARASGAMQNQKSSSKAKAVPVAPAQQNETQSANYSYATDSFAFLPNSVAAPDHSHAWKFGDGGVIAHTADGGQTYAAQVSPVERKLTAASAPSEKICWIAGASGTLLRTTNGGETWKIVFTPIAGDLGGVHAADELHATIWDIPNKLAYETSDGGMTWRKTANE
jgi:hypothetical protein